MTKYSLVLASLICIATQGQLQAASITFDESIIPANPINGFGPFGFDDFGAAGAVTATPTSIIFDVTDTTGTNGVFGGFGVDFVVDDGAGNFIPQDLDASVAQWDVRLKLLPNNQATALRFTLLDQDTPGNVDEHVYEFDLTSVPNDGQFHTLSKPLTDVLFTQGAFGFSPGDGAVNPGLRQIQIQTPFASTGQLNIELDFAQINTPAIPEPHTLSLLVLGLLGLNRRKAS